MKDIKKISKKILRRIKQMYINVHKRLTHPDAYLSKSEKYVHANDLKRAVSTLSKGLALYPNHIHLRKLSAVVLMEMQDWRKAIDHWKCLFNVNNDQMSPQDFLQYSEALQSINNFQEAEKVLAKGIKLYPTNEQIIYELSKIYGMSEKWEKMAETLLVVFESENTQPPLKAYVNLSKAYIRLGLLDRAEYIIREGMNVHPSDQELLNGYVDIAIRKKDWNSAIQCLEYLSRLYGEQVPFDQLIKRSMLYQIIGKHNQAQDLFNRTIRNYQQTIKDDKQGYRKIILYDNGESRIEFYKTLRKTDKVIVTFDSINMVWTRASFGFKFLHEQHIDIIAVRKRKKQTYHQDLSLEAFVNAVSNLVQGYKKKFAYGFSLGAYTALYYASTINCHILALAPRLSIHPLFGKPHLIDQYEFKHNLLFNYNSNIKPIIVFDPKNRMDRTFIYKEVVQAFPKSQFVEIPYGGHSLAPHLLNMGVLKEFVLTFLNGDIPKYNRKLKSKSVNYYRILGNACLTRNKLKWAKNLSERAYQMAPNDIAVITFKVNVYRRLNKYNDAVNLTKDSIKHSPKSFKLQFLLIDLYIEIKDLIKAEKQLNIAINKFGERPELIQKQQQIDEERENALNTPISIFQEK